MLLASGAFALPSQVWAQDAASATARPNTDEIVVIGTRRTDRTLTNTASPVDVISSAELQAQPTANLLDSLKNIIPSFFVGQNTISDASSFVRAPSLRGLPGDEVLIMLNGKRYNRSALVQVYSGGDTGLSFGSQGADISAIPSIAIKNLQVLRDGATAQYGSDAIAGVINYGLRDNKTGLEVIGRYGQYYDHGDGQSYQIAGNLGLALGSRGFVNLSAEYDNDGQTSRGATRPIALQFAAQNPGLANKLPNYPGPVQIWGSSPSDGYKLLLNSAYEVTDASSLYLFVNYARFHANESFNYRSPISGTQVDSAGVTHRLGANGSFNNIYLTPCPAGNPTCPAGGFVRDTNTFKFTSVYPAGFTPRFVGKTEELYGTAGYKGKTDGGFSYDISGSLSRNSLDLSMYNSLSPTFGPASQTKFNFGKLIQEEQDVNIDLSYPLAISWLASPLTISGGAEYRREAYTQTSGDPQSYNAGPYASQTLFDNTGPGIFAPTPYTAATCPSFSANANPAPKTCTIVQSPGASGYGGTSPQAAGTSAQVSFAGYVDLEADLTKRLSVGLAGRYETYDSFGDTVVGKANAIYRFSDAFSLRGTIGTGFHAPSPGQNNVEILTTNFIAGNQVQTGTYPVNNPIAVYYGAKSLRPEKSTNYGIGFIAKPIPRLTLTVDGYIIDVTSRIGITRNYNVTAADIVNQPALAEVGIDGNVNFFTNGFSTVTRGVDVVATYNMDLGEIGRLTTTLAYNYNKSSAYQYDATVINDAQRIDIAHLAPNHRIVLSSSLTHGKFTINSRGNFYSDWQDPVDYPVYDANNRLVGQKFGSKFTSDLDVTYAVTKSAALTVGALNLFNTYPDRIAQSPANPVYPVTGSTTDGQIYPRNGGPFGINGGFWYAKLRINY